MKLKSQKSSSVLTEHTMKTYLLLCDICTGIHIAQKLDVTSMLPEPSIQEFYIAFFIVAHFIFCFKMNLQTLNLH